MSEEKALNGGPAVIEVAYERLGDLQAPPVLLVMGIGAQLLGRPDGFCAGLVARGLQVVRFDNRDAGLSSHFPDAPRPDLPAALPAIRPRRPTRFPTWRRTPSACSTRSGWTAPTSSVPRWEG